MEAENQPGGETSGFAALLPVEDGPYTQHIDAREGRLTVRDRQGRERFAVEVGPGDDSRSSPNLAADLARALVGRVLVDGQVAPTDQRENETLPAGLAFMVPPARRGTFTLHRSEVFGEVAVRDQLGHDRLLVWVDWRKPFQFTNARGAALGVELCAHLGTETGDP